MDRVGDAGTPVGVVDMSATDPRQFRVSVTGSRSLGDAYHHAVLADLIDREVETLTIRTFGQHPRARLSIVSGGARGVDRIAAYWAQSRNLRLTVLPARWRVHGRSAGYRRNTEMARRVDAGLVLWDGESRGTAHMIDELAKEGKPHTVLNLSDMTVEERDTGLRRDLAL